ncbi:MAG: DUF1697 domain-containing protein [Acidimicrobiales bacterium]
MPRYVSLLRGINVAGRNKVPMAELRDLHELLGHGNVISYIQSGNVIFDAPKTKLSELSTTIEKAIAGRFGFEVPVVMRTAEQIELAIAASPFDDGHAAPNWRFIAFLSEPPSQTEFDGEVFAPDVFTVEGDHAHVLLPNGAAKSKLTTNYLEKALGVRATLRNHNTVNKIIGLAQQPDS